MESSAPESTMQTEANKGSYANYVANYNQQTGTQPFSQSCLPLQEHSRQENTIFGNLDWKLVKHKLSDVLSEDKSHRFSKMMDMTSCCSNQEIAEHTSQNQEYQKIQELWFTNKTHVVLGQSMIVQHLNSMNIVATCQRACLL
ncbi:hypothetical protein BsWGS_28873 [Bradybaena similaris]